MTVVLPKDDEVQGQTTEELEMVGTVQKLSHLEVDGVVQGDGRKRLINSLNLGRDEGNPTYFTIK